MNRYRCLQVRSAFRADRFWLAVTGYVLFGGFAGCGKQTTSAPAPPSPQSLTSPLAEVTPDAMETKIAAINRRQGSMNEKLAQFEQLLASRRTVFPAAKLWLTSDRTVYRTAVPEKESESLCWVVLHNGVEVLQRGAKKEMKLETKYFLHGSGTYTLYLSAFVDGAYLPISNVVSFFQEGNATDKNPKGAESPKPNEPPPSTPLKNAVSDERLTGRAAQLDRIEGQLDLALRRFSEFDSYVEQQVALPKRLNLWIDRDGVINRSVGPEEIERDITLSIDDPGQGNFSRNSRSQTQYKHYFRGVGEYRAVLNAGGKKISNEVTFAFSENARPAGYP